jgi:hypothetical protein
MKPGMEYNDVRKGIQEPAKGIIGLPEGINGVGYSIFDIQTRILVQ